MTSSSSSSTRIYADNAITGEIIRIIDTAKTKVALISPYVDKVMHVEQAIGRAAKKGVSVTVFTRLDGAKLGGGGKADEAISWFRQNGVEVHGVPNLHAKFYINETEAAVTSMNLLKSSWANSLELGVTVTGEAHEQLATYLNETIFPWAEAAPKTPAKTKQRTRTDKPKVSRPSKSPAASQNKASKGFFGSVMNAVKDALAIDEGFCIRCGEKLSDAEVDDGKTMCRKDYLAWAEYGRPNFKESFCTTCGEKRSTTYARPQCRECFDEGR
jgi:hypothetical protein